MEQVLPKRSFLSKTTHNADEAGSPWTSDAGPGGGPATAHGRCQQPPPPLLIETGGKSRNIEKKKQTLRGTSSPPRPPHPPPPPAQPKTSAPARLTAQASANPQLRYIVQLVFTLGYLPARCQGDQVISRKYLARGLASPAAAGRTRGLAGIPPARPPPGLSRTPGPVTSGIVHPWGNDDHHKSAAATL